MDMRAAAFLDTHGVHGLLVFPSIDRKLANLGQCSAAKRAADHKQLSTILGNYSDTN